jgi:hypothetical protein
MIAMKRKQMPAETMRRCAGRAASGRAGAMQMRKSPAILAGGICYTRAQ